MNDYPETDFQIFMNDMQDSDVPVLLGFLKNKLFLLENFEDLEDFRLHFSQDLKVFLASEKDQHLYAEEFDLRGYPIFVLFYKGKEVDRLFGVADQDDLKKFYLEHFGGQA